MNDRISWQPAVDATVQEEIMTDNVLPFIKPNPEEGTPDDLNWLKRLGVGTIFSCQSKVATDFIVRYFAVQSISDAKTYGLVNLMDNQPMPVDPVRFCNMFKQVEIIRNRYEYLAEIEKNDERDRANFPSGLVHDEAITPSSEPHEEGESAPL